jgi:thioester reductase-like protein
MFKYETLSHRNVSVQNEVQRMAAAAAGKKLLFVYDIWRRESNVNILKT